MVENMIEKNLLDTIDYCVNSKDNTSAFVRFQLVKLSNILKQTKIEDDEFSFIISDIEDIMRVVLSGYPVESVVDCLKTSFVKASGGNSSEVHIAEVLLYLRMLNKDEYSDIVASHKELSVSNHN